mgnify:CR=1 FL=1
MPCNRFITALLLILIAWPNLSWATNGYFQHGIGVKEQGLGGAAIAYPQSALSVATNPAAAATLGRQFDIGLNWFTPHRSADNGDGSGYHKSECANFIIPQLGYNHPLNTQLSFAFAAYANGGMKTDWPYSFFGTTETYSELEQMVIAPTLAINLNRKHALGLSINYIRQTFEARGLQGFAPATPSGTTAYLTDGGEDVSTGWGLRIGYSGQLAPALRIGAFWQPRTKMTAFDDYQELFAEGGELDIPETFGLGLAVDLSEKLTLATDLVKICYSDIPALSNFNTVGTDLLGTDNGPGFGWRDITVAKLGVAYRYSPALTLRIGWNHGENPVRSSQTAMNVLSPATIEDHLTLGFSWSFSANSDLSMAYWHGFENEIKGNFVAANGADAADIKMYQDSISLAWSWSFD